MKIPAIILFAAMYVVMIGVSKYRVHAVILVALIYLLTGIMPMGGIVAAINWNVLLMMTGTMVLVYYFVESKMPNKLAGVLLDHSPNVMWVTIYMSLFSGVVSAFMDNVATVIMIAPVALAICKKLKISPIPIILSIAVSSNLQGAATLVGDTTSIMLGAYANMDFNQFIWMHGRPSIFWAVELGAVATVPIMMWLFRKDKTPVEVKEETTVEDIVPTIMLCAMIIMLISASFIEQKPEITNGVICMAFAIVLAVYDLIRTHNGKNFAEAVKSVDFETLLLLSGMFIVIAGITNVGVIDDLAAMIVRIGGSSKFLLYSIIVWGSVLISAFVDNIPYVATMLPVLTGVNAALGLDPYLLFFGLLCGATLGGNLTPVGASANIAGMGLLKQQGYEASPKDFMRIGIPFTLTAVLVGYLFIWIVWR